MTVEQARRWARGPAGGLALVLLCFSVYLPGLGSISVIDRDEARFAQASRQMFESAVFEGERWKPEFHGGGWAVPMVQERPRLNKPPLIYWAQVASAWVFTGGDPARDAIWMYRAPSVLSSIIAVVLTWWFGRWMFDARAAWLGAAFLAVCPVVVFDAHQARADQLLLATVVASQGCLWRAWSGIGGGGGGWMRWAIAFWCALGVSILAKGPIGPMIAVLTVVGICVVRGSWRWIWKLQPVAGIVILACVVGPWVWMVGEHVGWEKYVSIVFDETIGRSVEGKEGHWGPPGYHAVLSAVLLWPGSMMAGLGVIRAWRKGLGTGVNAKVEGWRERVGEMFMHGRAGRDAELFLLAWIVPAWIVFELVGTKLPHYTLPMYPAILLLSARMILRMAGGRARESFSWIDRVGFGAWWVIGAVIWVCIVAIVVGTGVGDVSGRGLRMLVAVLLAPWLIVIAGALYRIRARGASTERGAGVFAIERQCTMVCISVAMLGTFFGITASSLLPGSQTPILARALEQGRAAVGNGAQRPASAYHEDSMIFATRGEVLRLNEDEIPAWLSEEEGRIALVEMRQGPFFEMGDSFDLSLRPSYRALVSVHTGAGPWKRRWVVVAMEVPARAPAAGEKEDLR